MKGKRQSLRRELNLDDTESIERGPLGNKVNHINVTIVKLSLDIDRTSLD